MTKTKIFYLKIRVELNQEKTKKQLAKVVEDLIHDVSLAVNQKNLKVVDATIQESATDFQMNNTF